MPLIWNNPNRDVREAFVACGEIALFLYLFGHNCQQNCLQVQRTGCLNRTVAECFARYLLRNKFLSTTPPYEGERYIEKNLERKLVKEFLGMRIARVARADLEDTEIQNIMPASRKDGDNRRCYARKKGLACFGFPATCPDVRGKFRPLAADPPE